MIRKNRNDGKLHNYTACYEDESLGVDLNRNYDFMFGISDEGSSGDPCAEDYRGPFPFSEPETQAIRDFVTQHQDDLSLAINFHAWGNLLIYPFNYDNTTDNTLLHQNFTEQSKIYEEI